MHFRMDDLPRNSADLGMIIVDDFDPIIYIYIYIYWDNYAHFSEFSMSLQGMMQMPTIGIIPTGEDFINFDG